jgi:hypothetical protein
MRSLSFVHSLALAAGLASLAGAAAADAPTRVPLDAETTLGGIDVACTGIGQTKNDPKWLEYPVRVEFADAQRAYLAGEVVTVSKTKDSDPLFSLTCEGPWVLLKLAPGSTYQVEAKLTERDTAPRSAVVKAPAHGQARFVITFPDAH